MWFQFCCHFHPKSKSGQFFQFTSSLFVFSFLPFNEGQNGPLTFYYNKLKNLTILPFIERAEKDKNLGCQPKNLTRFCFWMKMATNLKPQRPRFKRFEFWSKVAKVTKTKGSFWQFTLNNFTDVFMIQFFKFI
ncbi:hypothetical protein Hanom_Chr00s000810g01663651 [Helianthus anomalus]